MTCNALLGAIQNEEFYLTKRPSRFVDVVAGHPPRYPWTPERCEMRRALIIIGAPYLDITRIAETMSDASLAEWIETERQSRKV